jgi:transposase
MLIFLKKASLLLRGLRYYVSQPQSSFLLTQKGTDMNVKNSLYEGKRVFVGIDVHKKKCAVVAICDGMVVKKWTTISDHKLITEQIKKFFNGAKIESGYEAGFSGFKLHRVLTQAGIKNKVVNAASIEVESNNRVKTDKRDARKIAEQLAAGRLRCIYIPTEEEEKHRSLSRGREQIVSRRTAIGNQIKMKLYYLGYNIPERLKVSEKFFRWVEKIDLIFEHRFVLNELIDAWHQEANRIKRFNEELKKQAANDNLEKIYRSAPGMGPVSSRMLSNELGDMSRFNNERQLFSSSGLTPSEHSSGEHVRRGHISRQGSSRLRGLLVEVAWRAITEDISLKEFYSRVAKTRGGKKAIVAVARKMIGRLRKCLIDKVEWKDLRQLAEAA